MRAIRARLQGSLNLKAVRRERKRKRGLNTAREMTAMQPPWVRGRGRERSSRTNDGVRIGNVSERFEGGQHEVQRDAIPSAGRGQSPVFSAGEESRGLPSCAGPGRSEATCKAEASGAGLLNGRRAATLPRDKAARGR